MSNTPPLLQMSEVSKAFPGVQALDAASLSVMNGEIHGLVGENGAGKSTIIKVLAGVYQMDAGVVSLDGDSLDTISPAIIHGAGIRFIHQELHLVPHFTVAESVFMGQELSGPLGLKKAEMRNRAEAFLKENLGAEISAGKLIRNLGIAERKLVQIARALIDDKARLVVFDEPTAPLASGEIDQLYKAIETLKQRGISMIYVSHYLTEISDLCDRVTVFRNGKDVAVLEHGHAKSADEIIRHMVGRELGELYPERKHGASKDLYKVEKLTDGRKFHDVNMSVGKGEIVGIAGLIGSGREELTDALYGLHNIVSGSVHLNGENAIAAVPSDAVANGIALVPRDRRNDGLVLDLSVSDNINLSSLEEVSKFKWEMRGAGAKRADTLCETLDIRPRRPAAISRFLSGGNQQKVVLARWLATDSKLFILDEPTVGVDIGAKVEIYQLIENLAANGAGVLISSSDPTELLGMCDRIIVMMRGHIVANEQVADLTLERLVALTTSGNSVEAA